MICATALATPAAVSNLIANKAIPVLSDDELADIAEHLFLRAKTAVRINVAEVAYRNYGHPQACSLFLASAMPIAAKYSKRKTLDLFPHPSDWQFESLYHGAVMAAIRFFNRQTPLTSCPDGFRRYFLRTIATGALNQYFNRYEYAGVQAFDNLEKSVHPRSNEHSPEELVITHDLLEQVTHYPMLQRCLSDTLQAIADLGPQGALKEYAPWIGDDKHRRRDKALVLNMDAIAKARGIQAKTLYAQICHVRAVLRRAFNGDGRLFVTH